MSILSCAFYLGDTVQTAQRLLGKYVVRMLDGQALVARITETEAYVGRMDKAAHAYNYRQTARNAAMFGPPGHAYVYMIYGMHHCLNFVTEPEGEPSAVLLRGLEPVYGLDEMARLRFGKTWDALTRTQRRNITNGPGKCCRALAIDRAEHGRPRGGGALCLHFARGRGAAGGDAPALYHAHRQAHRDRLCRGGSQLPVALLAGKRGRINSADF